MFTPWILVLSLSTAAYMIPGDQDDGEAALENCKILARLRLKVFRFVKFLLDQIELC